MLAQKRNCLTTVSSFLEIGIAPSDENPLDNAEKSAPRPEDLADLSDVIVDITDKDRKQAEVIEETAEGVKKWLEKHLPMLAKIQKSGRSVQLKKDVQSAKAQITARVRDFLQHHEPAIRQSAWLAFLLYQMNHCEAKSQEDALRWVAFMVKRNWLDEGDEKSPFQAWGKRLRVPEEACFQGPQFYACRSAFSRLVQRISAQVLESRTERFCQWKKNSRLTVEEILSGEKEGEVLAYVPPEITESEDGSFKFRTGGWISLRSDGNGKIYPEEGFGYFSVERGTDFFADAIAEAKSMGVFILTKSLGWDWPPSTKLLMDGGLSEAMTKKIHLIWHILKKLRNKLIADKEIGNDVHQERVALGKNADISEQSFFLERETGTTLADFDGVVKFADKTVVWNVPILISRTAPENGDSDIIRVVGMPERVESLFRGCEKQYPEKERFEGVEHPFLQTLLRVCYATAQIKNLQNS